jgi:vacuolar-type H+-ATPase subunit E/Vma4
VRALRAEVEAEGRARVDAIREAARERIAELRAARARETAGRRSETLRRREAELRSALARELAAERTEARRHVLEARQALLARVFELARERLEAAVESPAARARLVERAREALGFVPSGEAVLRCSPGVAAVLGEHLEGAQGLRIETLAGLPVGFQVTGAGGTLVVDGTLESLLTLERPVLSIEVLRWLGAEAR